MRNVVGLKMLRFGALKLINLGSGYPTSVIDFARDLAKANNWSLNFRSGLEPSRTYEAKSFWSNSSKLTELLSGTQTSNRNADQ